jgi:hypothetical protein
VRGRVWKAQKRKKIHVPKSQKSIHTKKLYSFVGWLLI